MGDFMNRGKNLGTGFKNRGPVIEGGSFTNRGAEDQPGREFKNRGQAWFGGEFSNRGSRLLESSASWSPTSLFASSEIGVWYDPSDFSTMYQNSVGTTPVTAVGQPVGLLLDKSQGLVLGSELVTNGTFDTDLTGWQTSTAYAATAVQSGGKMVVTATVEYGSYMFGFSTVVGKQYKVSGNIYRSGGSSNVYISARATLGSVVEISNSTLISTTPTDVSFIFTAAGTTSYVSVVGIAASSQITVDNISVKELTGYHALESTAAERPLLDTANLINYDGIDDLLTASNPNLGTDVTIARATAGGVSILTGQTVGANYVDNTDHYGLVIVNRALTAGETTSLTTYLEGFIP